MAPTHVRRAASAAVLASVAAVAEGFGQGFRGTDLNSSRMLSDAAPRNKCPGVLDMPGMGPVEIIPTGWTGGPEEDNLAGLSVVSDKYVKIDMGGRAYFASKCTGVYNNQDYIGEDLLGKKIRFTVDVSRAGCGCNAAFYLTSMRQAKRKSSCNDYYCDANNVCGQSCPEVDIMEANKYAFHATLHTTTDHSGIGGGYGGGSTWNGPRDFTGAEYGPGARCIDTNSPYVVEAAFPTNNQGYLQGMFVTLLQHGKNCPLHINIENYGGMEELSQALSQGMTPIVSYWSSAQMLWMDGEGVDHQGPCKVDSAANCGPSAHMWGFSVSPLEVVIPLVLEAGPSVGMPVEEAVPVGEHVPQEAEAPSPAQAAPADGEPLECAATLMGDCRFSKCCREAGMQCFEKSAYWAACQETCSPGVDPRDPPGHHTPWSCKPIGKRTPAGQASAVAPKEHDAGHCSRTEVEDCSDSQCCEASGMQCYRKHAVWSACLVECISMEDDVWSCQKLGPRTPGQPAATTSKMLPNWEHEIWIPEKDTSEKVQEMFTTVTATYTTTTLACAIVRHEDCTNSRCCKDAGMQCYEKDEFWSSCQISCVPGIDERDPNGRRTPWTCNALGVRTAGEPLVTSTTIEPADDSPEEVERVREAQYDWSECSMTRKQDCTNIGCCRDPGMQCYEKNQFWSACQLDCVPGIDHGEDGDMRTAWSCNEIGPRTPGAPIVTSTTTPKPTALPSAADRVKELLAEEEREELEAIFESMEQPAGGFPQQEREVTSALMREYEGRMRAKEEARVGATTESPLSVRWVCMIACPLFVAGLVISLVSSRRSSVSLWVADRLARIPGFVSYRSLERQDHALSMPLDVVRSGIDRQDGGVSRTAAGVLE